jgi:hypothetical protein
VRLRCRYLARRKGVRSRIAATWNSLSDRESIPSPINARSVRTTNRPRMGCCAASTQCQCAFVSGQWSVVRCRILRALAYLPAVPCRIAEVWCAGDPKLPGAGTAPMACGREKWGRLTACSMRSAVQDRIIGPDFHQVCDASHVQASGHPIRTPECLGQAGSFGKIAIVPR